jgi:hypothetical protein
MRFTHGNRIHHHTMMMAADTMATATVAARITALHSTTRPATAKSAEVVTPGIRTADRRWIAAVSPNALEPAEDRTTRVTTLPLEIAATVARISAGWRMVDPFIKVTLTTPIARITT